MRMLLGALNALLGLILTLTPFWLAPVCSQMASHGGPMKCYYSGLFIVGMGAVVVAVALFALLRRGRGWAAVFAAFAAIVAAIACLLVPAGVIPLRGAGWVCGLCGDASHACRAVTMPFVQKVAAAIVAVNVVSLVLSFVRGNR
ncbi:DUF4418 family protein [Pyramidobacter porci]